jgi:hypothetical protein
MTSGGWTYIPSLMTTSSGIRVTLRVLPQQFDRLQCWYYWWDGFKKYAIEMASSGMIHTYQVPWRLLWALSNIKVLPQTSDRLQCWYCWCKGNAQELGWWDGLRCHTKFHKDWFRQSKVVNGGGFTQTARWSHKPTSIFSQNTESSITRQWQRHCNTRLSRDGTHLPVNLHHSMWNSVSLLFCLRSDAGRVPE